MIVKYHCCIKIVKYEIINKEKYEIYDYSGKILEYNYYKEIERFNANITEIQRKKNMNLKNVRMQRLITKN